MREEIILTTTLGTALLDMYGKAGDMEMGLTIFDQIRDKEVCAWTAIISALASNGRPKQALEMFEMMKSKNVHPNGITLLAILTACARSKLVDLGIHCSLPFQHQSIMVALMISLAELDFWLRRLISQRIGHSSQCYCSRGTLLGACKFHENAASGNKVGKQLIELQPQHCVQNVALSTLNVLGNNWSEAEEMRKVMIQAGIQKRPAYSVLS